MRLSIGQAWDETKAVLRRDGSLIAVVALALLVLPAPLSDLRRRRPPPAPSRVPSWTGALVLLSADRPCRADRHQPHCARAAADGRPGDRTGFRRLPAFFARSCCGCCPSSCCTAAVLAAAAPGFTNPSSKPSPQRTAAGLAILALLIIFLIVAVHMLFTSPRRQRRAEPVGPIAF
jgi:hypothetical protein